MIFVLWQELPRHDTFIQYHACHCRRVFVFSLLRAVPGGVDERGGDRHVFCFLHVPLDGKYVCCGGRIDIYAEIFGNAPGGYGIEDQTRRSVLLMTSCCASMLLPLCSMSTPMVKIVLMSAAVVWVLNCLLLKKLPALPLSEWFIRRIGKEDLPRIFRQTAIIFIIIVLTCCLHASVEWVKHYGGVQKSPPAQPARRAE